jgi:7-carboxy-7-deazaguanine synthase
MLQVIEIYPCFIGEGLETGLPALLVRLAGCNLRCVWCDTAFAQTEAGRSMPLNDLLYFIKESGHRRVLLTGGEPLQCPEVNDLCAGLLRIGVQVILETNGSLPIAGLPRGVVRIVDIKCPDSQPDGRPAFLMANLAALLPGDQLKICVASRNDYDWARRLLETQRLPIPVTAVLFSPVWDKVPPRTLAQWMQEDRLPYRFHVQMHKFVWGEQRGV